MLSKWLTDPQTQKNNTEMHFSYMLEHKRENMKVGFDQEVNWDCQILN